MELIASSIKLYVGVKRITKCAQPDEEPERIGNSIEDLRGDGVSGLILGEINHETVPAAEI